MHVNSDLLPRMTLLLYLFFQVFARTALCKGYTDYKVKAVKLCLLSLCVHSGVNNNAPARQMCILFSCIVKCEEGSMGYRESSFDKFTILLPVLSCLLSPKKVALHDVSPIYQGNSSLFKCLSFRGLNSLRKLKRHW